MVRICQRCRRANPTEATYCHHDGVLLDRRPDVPPDGSAIDISGRPFPTPFVFPSGRSCRNYNQLALACHADPAVALDLLRKGHLASFLAAQGRADLAEAAGAAAGAADGERGLDDFLDRLPAFSLRPARLRVEPAALDLGILRLGEDRRCEVVLRNDGMRLLHGSASCDDQPWLSLGDGPPLKRKLFQFSGQTVLPLHIHGRQLRAFHKPQEAEVRLESNGGAVTVAVRLNVPVLPFPEGVLAGAVSPRQMAEKARTAPVEAAPLIERGAVARWYKANGWDYPVREPAAGGVAAVQQLFEALGLARPPKVQLSEDAVWLLGAPGAKVEYVLAVVSQENRAAVAHATSDQPWLQVGPTVFRGRSAFLPLSVSAVPGTTGDTLRATLSITANGNQRFVVPVTLVVGSRLDAAGTAAAPAAIPHPPRQLAVPGPAANAAVGPAVSAPPLYAPRQPAVLGPAAPLVPPAPAPVSPAVAPPPAPPPPVAPPAVSPPVVPAPPSRKEARTWRSVWRTLLPAGLLVVVVLGAVLRDYLAPEHKAGAPGAAPLDPVPRIEIRFHDIKKNDDLETLWLTDPQPTMRFGLVMLHDNKEIGQGIALKRLTFDQWGRTNNTCLRLDGNDERLFGSARGSWEERADRRWQDEQGKDHDGVRSVWSCDDKKIEVTQFVELVRGEQSRLLDTCRVRYRIDNRDGKAHPVGIRFLLDSYIGGNDGVPFTIPGESELCDTLKDIPAQAKDKKIPDFLQALEKPDLAHPGTIAHLRLKLENLKEAPVRVTLGAWPNEKLRVQDRKALGPSTLWDVPLLPMKALDLNDSAIVIYWKEEPLEPGASREVGFEYGLWTLASQGSRLATTIDGAFRPGGQLTVVVYVNTAGQEGADETVTLDVPEGFEILEGDKTRPLPKLPRDARSGNRPVTWKVKAGPTGKYEFKMKTSSGPAQSVPVEIKDVIY